MKSDAYIHVTCDKCGYDQEIGLTACARKSWDERYVNSTLKKEGWYLTEDQHLCSDCTELN